MIYPLQDAIILVTEKEAKQAMNILQICDYAAKYRGNFIESLEYFRKNSLSGGNSMIYAFPDRMLKRNNQWYIDLSKETTTAIYKSSVKEKIKTFRKIIKENGIDIVHTHFTDLKTDMCVNIACFGLHVKKFKHYRSSFGRFGAVKKFFARLCYRKWNAVLCVSPHIMREVENNIVSCKSVLLNDAVYFPRMDDYEKLSKTDLGFPKDSVLCLAIGYDYRLKGIDIACVAVKKLREKGQNMCLAVCTASNTETIAGQIEAQFGEFPKWIRLLPPRQDIASYYRAADIYIQSSRSEGFCYAIVEAAYCGKAVAASDCPGMKSHAENNFDFLWFKNGDSDSLAEKLKEAVKIAADTELVEKNRRSAIENYSMEGMAKKLYRIYSDM